MGKAFPNRKWRRSWVVRIGGNMNERRQTNELSRSGDGSSWVNILLGIWVLISPFVLTLALPRAIWNNVVTGFVVGILAIIRVRVPNQTGWSWINALLGIWLIISPFVLGFASGAGLWNNVILGIIVAAFALSNTVSRTAELA
jgi:SPW repeat